MLGDLKAKGSDSGARATQTVQDLLGQTRTALRSSRESSLKAAQAMMDGYAALVSGVLIGMSDGLQGAGASPEAAAPKAKKK